MPDEYLDAALDDLNNILAIVDGVDINAEGNPEWAEVAELLMSIKVRAKELQQELSPE